MKILKSLSPFLMVCVMAAAHAEAPANGANSAPDASAGAPAAAIEFKPEHLAAAERIVYAMALPERFIIPTSEMIKLSKTRDPVNAGLMGTVFDPYLEKKYTAEKLKPFFASRFDIDTCQQIATFWEGPVGKKLVKTQIKLLTTGQADRPVYNRNEKSILKKFEATAAGQAMLQAMPDIEDALSEYTRETQTKMREEFLRQLERRLKSGAQAAATPAPMQ